MESEERDTSPKTEVKVRKVLRNAKGQYLKGSLSPSPGRPPLGQTSLDQLLRAIVRVENKKNKKLLDHYIERAFKSDPVLCSLMKKLLPDLQSISQLNFDVQMNDTAAANIRKKLQERYKHSGTEEQSQ